MMEFILFIVIAMSMGVYQDQQYKEDFGKNRETIMDLACNDTVEQVDIRINPPVIREGETIAVPSEHGTKTCTMRGGQLFCTDVWL